MLIVEDRQGERALLVDQRGRCSMRDRHEMLVVASVLSPDALRVTLQLGDRRPLHAAAAGKIFLAYLPDRARERIIAEAGLPALTSETIIGRKELETHLATVRRNGIAWNNGESANGVGGVAAPVFVADGSVIAAVPSVFPLHLVKSADRATLADHVRRTARELSLALGWTEATAVKRS